MEIQSSYKAYGFIAALFQVENTYPTTLCGIVLRCFTYSVCGGVPKGWNQLLDQKNAGKQNLGNTWDRFQASGLL